MTQDDKKSPSRSWASPDRFLLGVIVLAGITFVALNAFVNATLPGARLDLTQNRLFTLSDGTREVLSTIDEPITLRFFYSESVGAELPDLNRYAQRVRDMLEAFEARAGGRLEVQVIEPEPFSESEDLAVALGMQGVPTQSGDQLYFGLSGVNSVDGRETIPFFAPSRERFVEYDLTEMISKLNAVKQPRLGLLTGLPLAGTPGNPMDPRSGTPPALLYSMLAEQFDIDLLPERFESIDPAIDVVMIAHPRAPDEATLYAIDQFVMRGGRLLVFVDPQAESVGGNPFQPGPAPPSSDLDRLFKAWGVEMVPGQVVADRSLAQLVATSNDPRRPAASYVVWLGVTSDDMAEADVVTATLDRVIIATSGALRKVDGATTSFSPLIWSTTDSQLLPVSAVQFMPQPDELLRGFAPTAEAYTLAARVSGPVASAFPDGRPAPAAGDAEAGAAQEPAELPEHLAASVADANLILVADSDLLDDRFWADRQTFLNRQVVIPRADNANFVMGAIENLMGSDALISLRARAEGSRPFTRVEALRQRAEAAYLAREQALQTRISETEQRLQELQGEAEPGTDGAVLSPAMRAEIDRARAELLQARAELRDVQRSLRADIENLGATMKFLNIIAIPLLVALLAVVLVILGRRRRAAQAR